MSDLGALVENLVASAEHANRAAADRMYEALSVIARGCADPQLEARLALEARDRVRPEKPEVPA